MFIRICLAIILLCCSCVRINAQCTNKGCENKYTVSAQDIADQILQILNLLPTHDQNLHLQFQNLLSQTKRQVVATQGIADQILQIQNSLDKMVQPVCGKKLTQFERQDICGSVPLLRDCNDIKASGQLTNGVYPVYVEHRKKLYSANAFCDTTSTYPTSWLVFQRRKDGSVDFYRTWSEYATGFGDPNGEFWLGNEMLHLLTSKRNYKLRVDLEDFEGNRRYAEYAKFSIGPSSDNYRLNISGYSGDAGDSLLDHNGMQFSTKDADNDIGNSTRGCAVHYHGAWWYEVCYWSNLNGKYYRGNYSGLAINAEGVTWNSWRGKWYSYKTTEMKIAPVIGFA